METGASDFFDDAIQDAMSMDMELPLLDHPQLATLNQAMEIPVINPFLLPILNHFISTYCSSIALRSQAHLERIISGLIKKLKFGEVMDQDLRIAVEAAIWRNAAIRPEITFAAQTTALCMDPQWNFTSSLGTINLRDGRIWTARISPKITGVVDRIQKLELGLYMLAADAPAFGAAEHLVKATKAMPSLRQQLPHVVELTLSLIVDVSSIEELTARSDAWWQTLYAGPGPTFFSLPEYNTLFEIVKALLMAAQEHGPGFKKIFKLLVKHDADAQHLGSLAGSNDSERSFFVRCPLSTSHTWLTLAPPLP